MVEIRDLRSAILSEQKNIGVIINMRLRSYNEDLQKRLLNVDEAAEYLTACFEDSEEVFLLGLRQVVEAHGGIGTLAEETKLNRESLYRMLSESGNPKLSSLAIVLATLGLRLHFSPLDDEEKEAA